MTESHQQNPELNLDGPAVMPIAPPEVDAPAQRRSRIPAAARAAATAASAAKAPTSKPTKQASKGPAPARIVAAAASVAAGVGLVTLMAGAQQDVVVQVNPTPVTVQPASVIVELQPAAMQGEDGVASVAVPEVEVRVVEAAVAVEQPAPQARAVTQSEGS